MYGPDCRLLQLTRFNPSRPLPATARILAAAFSLWAGQASVIYDNTQSQFAKSTSFTALPQGDEVRIAELGHMVSLLEIGVFRQNVPGVASFQARLFANDGPLGMPDTLLWESALREQVALSGGVELIRFEVPDIEVPEVFTWTLQIFDTGDIAAGLPWFGPASIGFSPDYAWFGPDWTAMGDPSVPANYLARITVESDIPLPESAPALAVYAGLAAAAGVSLLRRARARDRLPN